MNHGWHAQFRQHDLLGRWVEITIYADRGDGRVEVIQPDDIRELLEPGVEYGGPPTLRLRSDEFDALIDMAYEERIRRGTAPDTEVKVLREILAKEQARVDHALNMETGP